MQPPAASSAVAVPTRATSPWHVFLKESRRKGLSMAAAGQEWRALSAEGQARYVVESALIASQAEAERKDRKSSEWYDDADADLEALLPWQLGDAEWPVSPANAKHMAEKPSEIEAGHVAWSASNGQATKRPAHAPDAAAKGTLCQQLLGISRCREQVPADQLREFHVHLAQLQAVVKLDKAQKHLQFYRIASTGGQQKQILALCAWRLLLDPEVSIFVLCEVEGGGHFARASSVRTVSLPASSLARGVQNLNAAPGQTSRCVMPYRMAMSYEMRTRMQHGRCGVRVVSC